MMKKQEKKIEWTKCVHCTTFIRQEAYIDFQKEVCVHKLEVKM